MMSASTAAPYRFVQELLAKADIQLNGGRPHDIRIHRQQFFEKVLSRWSLGLGESYMDGDWDCQALDQCITRLLSINLDDDIRGKARAKAVLMLFRAKIMNLQSRHRAFQVAERHYDLDNDLFWHMLDSRMIYSCAYWERASTLEQAQIDKLDLICQKLELQPGEHLLDIGCGWGGLAAHAAQHYGVKVTGLTVSREQKAHAMQTCAGLPIDIRLQDYRDLDQSFDKIVSVGMFEHVGERNYPTYFQAVHKALKPEGLFLLHTIGSRITTLSTDPWIDKYIFPNGKIPSAAEITQSVEPKWVIEDWQNFGRDYDRTLMAWHGNIVNALPTLSRRYDARFLRMWSYYLLSCAGYFRSQKGQLWQILLTRPERSQGYRSLRFRQVRDTPLSDIPLGA
jgi:cyclopropane-fatty-acyl-phospholipid synthase